MPRIHLLFCAITFAVLSLGGCKESKGESAAEPAAEARPWPPENVEGAWLGTGQITAQAGTQAVKAQLELLSNGTYRFMVIEPRVLMMMGMEEGDWNRAEQQVQLTPYKDQVTTNSGFMSNAPRNYNAKSLEVEGTNEALLLKDDKMDLRFLPNHKASDNLRKRGDLK